MINEVMLVYWQWRKRWHQREADYWLSIYAHAPYIAREHEEKALRAGTKVQKLRAREFG